MKLSFVLDQARAGELEQLSSKSKTDRVIVAYINLALIALHNRFVLDSDEAIITLRDGKSVYNLDGTDADVSLPANDPTGEAIQSIIYGYEENGTPIAINDSADPYAIQVINYNTIQVPIAGEHSFVSVIYSKSATTIPDLGYDIDGMFTTVPNYDIEIPKALIEPLLHYIGYRAHGSRNGDIKAENNTHLMRFKASCDEIERLGVVTSTDNGYNSVQSKGYA